MGLFLSTIINKIDKKGRVSVPASYRAHLINDDFSGVVLFPSYTQTAIEAVPMSMMETMTGRVDDHFDFFSDDHDDLATVLFGNAVALAFDGDGRITLPQDMMDQGQLNDKVAFVGMGKKFQLWCPDLLKDRQAVALDAVKSKKMTLPSTHYQSNRGNDGR